MITANHSDNHILGGVAVIINSTIKYYPLSSTSVAAKNGCFGVAAFQNRRSSIQYTAHQNVKSAPMNTKTF